MVANALQVGNSTVGPIAKTDLDNLSRIIDTKFKGTAYCLQAVTRVMIKEESLMVLSTSARAKERQQNLGRGAIVNLRSALFYVTSFGSLAYTSSQHSIIGLNKTAVLDHARYGIHVNAECPGAVDLAMMRRTIKKVLAIAHSVEADVPLGGRMAAVGEIAGIAAFLCGPGATYVTRASVKSGNKKPSKGSQKPQDIELLS